MARDAFGRPIPAGPPAGEAPADAPRRREAATESIGRRAGALSDELDFPEFVASLVHGTFDAIVDSSIRQMETFADLIAAVAKPLDQFMAENVTPNQARDHLAERYPQDVALASSADGPRLVPRGGDEAEPASPAWLQDYGLAGEPLTAELLEGALLPRVREQVAAQRLQTLSTLVLMGMNRVVVKDGSINARLRFRAMAADRTMVDYAAGDEAGRHADGTEWGRRGARTYAAPVTKVATVGINAQADSELRAELFGEVRINFASETVPLDRFVDEARRRFVERHARAPQADRAGPGVPPPVPGAGERQP
ncbi:MAG: hypothetical protein ACK4MT_05790 [Thermaurantiacus tibetensis]